MVLIFAWYVEPLSLVDHVELPFFVGHCLLISWPYLAVILNSTYSSEGVPGSHHPNPGIL